MKKLRLVAFFVFTTLMFTTGLAARPKTTRAEAVSIVRSILQRNANACRFSHGPITVARVKAGWRISTKLTLNGRGKPYAATAVWTVGENGGDAVPANQLTSEISNGCP
ncbi:MAG TPA: hypothetical protein VGJ55_14210 [Pyrinomonadaceae bacterium]|jgi:hypothetical protein